MGSWCCDRKRNLQHAGSGVVQLEAFVFSSSIVDLESLSVQFPTMKK